MSYSSPFLRVTINRRARNLAVLTPIFDLQRIKSTVTSVPVSQVDVLRVVAEILDVVITEMSGRWSGVTHEDLLEKVSPRVARAAELGQAEAEAVVGYVVDGLLNQKARDSFRVRHQVEHEDGRVEWEELVFKLLKEELDEEPPRGIRIQATPEAINLHLASLSVEIEAAQAAEEAMIHHFVAHGRHRDAGLAAKRALDLSISLRQRLRQLFRAVTRQVSRIDYEREFAPELKAAREHLQERISAEAKLIAMVEDRLPQAQAHDRADLVQARDTIQAACRQHEALAAELMQAGQQFLDETMRQRFRRLPSAVLIDPWRDYASPLLRAPVPRLAEWFGAAPWTLFGVGVKRPAHLPTLVTLLLREPEDIEQPAPEPAPDLAHDTPSVPFLTEDYDALAECLRRLPVSVRLGEALRQLEDEGASVAVQRLLVLHAGWWFAEDGGDEDPAGRPLRVEVLPEALRSARFYGTELLLTKR